MSDSQSTSLRHERPIRRRLMKATAVLGPNQRITVTGELVDFDFFVASQEELLKRAKKARAEGLSLSTFLLVQKEIAEASSC